MKLIFALCCSIGLLTHSFAQEDPSWGGNLKPGPYKPAFKVIREKDKTGKLFLFSLWYPAVKAGDNLTLRDYVETGIINGREDKQVLDAAFKETLEIPSLFGVEKMSAEEYDKLLATPVRASANAEMKKGKWPLVISDTEPVSLFVTNEWIAYTCYVVLVDASKFL